MMVSDLRHYLDMPDDAPAPATNAETNRSRELLLDEAGDALEAALAG
jgi:hypothetical protein